MLIAELKKIELRKKEREKKTQDLQKLITAADNNAELRRTERKITKKKIQLPQSKSRKELEGSSKVSLSVSQISWIPELLVFPFWQLVFRGKRVLLGFFVVVNVFRITHIYIYM